MLYTRKGDTGTTKIFNCDQRISKSSQVSEALGVLDELNSFIGWCKTRDSLQPVLSVPTGMKRPSVQPLSTILNEMQEALFIMQAEVAGAPKKIHKRHITSLENTINAIEKVLRPITGFTIVGGTELSAMLDVARTITRRAERQLVTVHEEGHEKISAGTLAYANRLSSLLFALARFVNHTAGISESAPSYR
ncbi:MAG TPA: cob(I)yrinic acid a,c-diamide adenosyltransferase [Candidatus Kaiserbacteria bacterium]|nr:cob(I)yrinic acid a,c-diamide adenosyltransferase [Candidatus Kaiserbacteria bacterium]